ncbi:MAG: alpha/beta fold hydrolase [Gemmatimonadetes bacterium]|nr:alpha/beta fold hydrolase [Gemmatimonadota bacterium]
MRKILISTLVAACAAVLPAAQAASQDTVRLSLPSGDANLDALLYRAAGAGARPTVLLLHGYPGNQQNLDIAEAAQAAGWNVLLLHYRGSWGSAGAFSVANAVADVGVALAALRSPAAAREWRVDAARIAVVGHSMGGALALGAATRDRGVRCVAALAPANAAVQARLARDNPGFRAGLIEGLEAPTKAASPPIRFAPGATGADLADYLIAHADSLDLVAGAARLAKRPRLLVGGADDRLAPPGQHVQPLLDALQAAGARQVTAAFLADDHNFSAGRGKLVDLVVQWLGGACFP